MFGFKKQIIEESKRIDSLLENIGSFDEDLAKGSIRKRAGKDGEPSYILECKKSKNEGADSTGWIPLGGVTDSKSKAAALIRYKMALAKRLKKNQSKIKKWEKEFVEYDWDSLMVDLGKNVQEILEAVEVEQQEAEKEWMKEDYDRNEHDFHASHVTITGEKVRSKNEVIIYNMLHAHNLCFRYESKLSLEDEYGNPILMFPDFTIKGKDDKFIIWEHLGMMNNPRYCGNFAKRIGVYERNGYHLWDNLFFSIDSNGEIDAHTIEKIIREFVIPKVQRDINLEA
ncbi:MAG: hypothetical protein J6H21_02375 [Firmicutes bacterium]|nr:hypothetical protein [Bacillota bacterium]